MTESKRGRPSSTPNIDRVIEVIKSGAYDERILELHEALNERRDALRAQVLERVKEVFGENYTVVDQESKPKEKNPFIAQARAKDVRKPDGNFRTNPDNEFTYRLIEDYGNGMVLVSEWDGRNQHSIPKAEWESWEARLEIHPGRLDSQDVELQPEGNDDAEFVPQPIADPAIEHRGPIIGGLSTAHIAD